MVRRHDDAFLEHQFRRQVNEALVSVRRILDTTRTPCYAAEVDTHTYEDKFLLTEWLTQVALSAVGNAFEKISDMFFSLESDRRITLRFSAAETCDFVEERKVKVESPQSVSQVTETTTTNNRSTTTERTLRHKVVTEVTEYHWKVGFDYKFLLFSGTGDEDEEGQASVTFRHGMRSCTLSTTGSKEAPFVARNVSRPIDVDITWLFRHISAPTGTPTFSIDRSSESCRTPRRNKEVEDALQEGFLPLKFWCQTVCNFLSQEVERKTRRVNDTVRRAKSSSTPPETSPKSLGGLPVEQAFLPIVPLLEKPRPDKASRIGSIETCAPSHDIPSSAIVSSDSVSSSHILPVSDANKFLQEHCRSLDSALAAHADLFPKATDKATSLVTVEEADLVVILRHMSQLCTQYKNSVGYVEHMLRTQLIKAIGKQIGPKDFDEYTRFHNRKWFAPKYAPQPFTYAIRRPHHYPDGVVSIEEKKGESSHPVSTFCRDVTSDLPSTMSIPINPATTIPFQGRTYLHGWMLQMFGDYDDNRNKYELVARARQFSCFLLMVGKMTGPDTFEPQEALILQNKDEVLIPLLLEQLPSAKEFRKAVSSLSPEQENFAKAFRAMQLESSVFGICVVQLKPQLETLLKLPSNSLTKEIRLTQDLLSLFIDYQIPSDLLSFDDGESLSSLEKLSAVRGHVSDVLEVINKAKADKLLEAERQADMQFETTRGRRHTSANYYDAEEEGSISSDNFYEDLGEECCFEEDVDFDDSGDVDDELCGASKWKKEANSDNGRGSNKESQSGDAEGGMDVDGKGVADNDSAHVLPNLDLTTIPKRLDTSLEDMVDGCAVVRPTTIKTEDIWTKKSHKGLVFSTGEDKNRFKVTTLNKDQGLRSERNKAFDLLDALSCSGSLPLRACELHVVVAATHSFGNSLVDTVVQDNVNPIKKMEQSTLALVSVVHGETVPHSSMVRGTTM